MTLYQLSYGRSKNKLRVIMIDSLQKCRNYLDARDHSVSGFHKIEPAPKGSESWRKKSATRGGNKPSGVGRVKKDGSTSHGAGYINKHGFQHHT